MEIEQRVERLERQNQRLKRGMAAMAAAGLALMIMGTIKAPRQGQGPGRGPAFSSPKVHDVLRARRIHIVGRDGRDKVQLGAEKNTGVILVFGAGGLVEVAIAGGTPGEGGTVGTFLPGSNKPAVLLSTHSGGDGGLIVYDRRGKEMMSISSNAAGEGRLVQYGGAGRPRSVWPPAR